MATTCKPPLPPTPPHSKQGFRTIKQACGGTSEKQGREGLSSTETSEWSLGGQGPRLHCSPVLVHPFLCPPQHIHPCLGRGRWNVLEGPHSPAPLAKALFIPAVFLGLGFPHHPPDSGNFTLCRASGKDPVTGEGGAEKQTSRLEQRWGGGPDCRTERGARPGERQPSPPSTPTPKDSAT